MTEQPVATPPEQPSRYDRSFGGLLAAMIVTVLFVAAYVGFRSLTRDQPDVVEKVDYLSCVAYLQEADVTVAYPGGLPPHWTATSINFERGNPPRWRVGMVTGDDEFVGVVQQKKEVEDLLHSYVDQNPAQGADSAPVNTLGAAQWQTWSDAGGDHAFSTVLDSGPLAGQTLLVYGSAPVADQEAVLATLTLDPVGSSSSATDCDTDDLQ